MSLTISSFLLWHQSKKLLGLVQLEVRTQQSQPGAMIFMTKTHLSWLTQWNKRLGGHTGLRDANSIDGKDADLVGHTFNHFLGLKGCFFAEIEIQPHPSGALFLFPLNEIPWRGHKIETGFSLAYKSKLCQILEFSKILSTLSEKVIHVFSTHLIPSVVWERL